MLTKLANSSEVNNVDLFYAAISYFVYDKNMRVCFEAITAFTKIPTWEKFEDYLVPSDQKKVNFFHFFFFFYFLFFLIFLIF